MSDLFEHGALSNRCEARSVGAREGVGRGRPAYLVDIDHCPDLSALVSAQLLQIPIGSGKCLIMTGKRYQYESLAMRRGIQRLRQQGKHHGSAPINQSLFAAGLRV